MANPLADIWSFGPAAARPDGQLLVTLFADALVKAGDTDTTLLWYDGGKKLSMIGELPDLVRCVRATETGFVAVTEDGIVAWIDGGVISHRINLFDLNPAPRPFGPARSCHVDGDRVIVVGLNQTALACDRGTDRVTDVSAGLSPDKTRGLESVTGPAWNDLTGVDLGGGIWQFDGQRWRDSHSPVNAPLTSICPLPDGDYFAAGLHGTFVIGRAHAWKALEIPLRSINFYSVATRDGVLYAAGPRGVVSVQPDTDEAFAVEFDSPAPDTFYEVIASGELLWSIGPKDIVVNRAGRWKSLFQ